MASTRRARRRRGRLARRPRTESVSHRRLSAANFAIAARRVACRVSECSARALRAPIEDGGRQACHPFAGGGARRLGTEAAGRPGLRQDCQDTRQVRCGVG
eukprot:scaffold112013_cov63-Phaeocystis_antarctica.AAC.1